MSDKWSDQLETELGFWTSVITDPVPEGVIWAAAGIDIAPQRLRQYLIPGKKILDVGSGPICNLGRLLDGFPLDVKAVDPLAHEYEKHLHALHLYPLVPVEYARAEELSSHVCEKYDFIYSRNALDHSSDPIKCIHEIIKVLAPGGMALLENVINEGLRQGYQGMHFWNFMPADGNLVIWNETESHLLSGCLAGYGDVSFKVSTFVDDGLRFVSTYIEKAKV